MFGISGMEMLVIAVILIIAVGPNRMPSFLKAVVKGYQEFRRATRELRASTGIDEIFQDEDLKSLRKPLYVPPPKPAAPRKRTLTPSERNRESPREGVDIVEAREASEQAERVRQAKSASAERALAQPTMEARGAEAERMTTAKLGAADDESAGRVRAGKTAAAERAPEQRARAAEHAGEE
jgi:Sec-independent protein translocase protein TatA